MLDITKRVSNGLERSYAQGKVYASLEVLSMLLKAHKEDPINANFKADRDLVEKLMLQYKEEYEKLT